MTSSPVSECSIDTDRMGGLDRVREMPAPSTTAAEFLVRTTLDDMGGPLQPAPLRPKAMTM